MAELSEYLPPEAYYERLGSWFHVPNDRVVVGPGVDALLERLLPLLVEQSDGIVLEYPSYPFYQHICERWLLPFQERFILSTLGVRAQGWLGGSIGLRRPLFVLANPKNPSGECLSKSLLESIIGGYPEASFLVDESYIDYCPKQSVVGAIGRFPNLVVLRGFSKGWGLPALRLGVGVTSNRHLIEQYDRRYPLMDVAASSLHVLERVAHSPLLRWTLMTNRSARRRQALRVVACLKDLRIPVCDTHTNLVFGHLPAGLEERIANACAQRGIGYTRPGQNPWLDRYYQGLTRKNYSYFRFSCGEGTNQLIKALRSSQGKPT